ncbi:MAG: hypothetical protein ACPL5I_13360 [Thermodesulfobacteriota bacterium]
MNEEASAGEEAVQNSPPIFRKGQAALKYSYHFVGQAFMACQMRQGSSSCPTAAASFQ